MKTAQLSIKQLAQICDHTFLNRPESYRNRAILGENPIKLHRQDFQKFLEETCEMETTPYAICVRPEDVPHAKSYLKNGIRIVAAVGFPDGSWISSSIKYFESQFALEEGASEIDMVMNAKALKEGNHSAALQEIEQICRLVHSKGGKLKVIIETCELNQEQMAQACHLAAHAGADFVKTSTGYGSFGAKVEDLVTIRKNFSGGIKISGGVNLQNVYNFLNVFADKKSGKIDLDPTKIRIGESHLLSSS